MCIIDENTVYQRWHFFTTWYGNSRSQAKQTCTSDTVLFILQVILFFFCLIRNVNLLSIVWPQEILLILKENSSIFWQLNDTSCFKIRNCISAHKNSWKKSLKFKVYFAMEMKLKKANVGNKLLKAIKNHYS